MTFDEKAYKAREKEIFERDLAQAEEGTRSEKALAASEWISDCQSDPELVAERVSWLLAGHYGKGAFDVAWEAVDSKFVKPTTRLLEIIAGLEWSVARKDRGAYWRKLTPEQQHTLVAAVERVVKAAVDEREGDAQ